MRECLKGHEGLPWAAGVMGGGKGGALEEMGGKGEEGEEEEGGEGQVGEREREGEKRR